MNGGLVDEQQKRCAVVSLTILIVKQVVAIVVTVLVGLIATDYKDKSLPSDHQSINSSPPLQCKRCRII